MREGSYRARAGFLTLPFRDGCGLDFRDFFIGTWMNGVSLSGGIGPPAAVGWGSTELMRDRVRAAIESWETGVCPCSIADINADGELTFGDVSAFIEAFNTGEPEADVNGDGFINFRDVTDFIAALNAGCP